MNNNGSIYHSLLLLIFWLLISSKIYAVSPETQQRLDYVLSNWRSITPEILKLPENEEVLQELGIMAQNNLRIDARVPLIKLGDQEVIESCLKMLHSASPSNRNFPAHQLGAGANPDVIPRLIEDLLKEENADEDLSGEVGVTPLSSVATTIIITIINESPAFTPRVKEWARQFPPGSNGRRAGIRIWWDINKDALIRKDYQAVVAGPKNEREVRHPSTPAETQLGRQPSVEGGQKEHPQAPTEASGGVSAWQWFAGAGILVAITIALWSRR